MKKLIILFLAATVFACNNTDKSQKQPSVEINPIDSLNMSSGDFENMSFLDSDTLTNTLRGELQIENIEELSGYDNRYLYKGKTIAEVDKGSILSLFVYTEGEASEFLISYDAAKKYIDHVIVGYEDWVEGYSKTSSQIVNGKLTIETVNFDYSEDIEKSDTIFEHYNINPDLTFSKKQ